ncbi:unnamed protein product [marine sediment metagenome]|uniref:Nucleotidyl transferase domain-containing protein n=1 Tax=marine sediment metagenome TaxID=412755 RepID=X0UUH6_9ZZZZ
MTILTAGMGSRLRPLTANKRKCLARVAGKSILNYQIGAFVSAGMKLRKFKNREHVTFWTVKDCYYWAKKVGFEVVACKGQRGFPYLWKCFSVTFCKSGNSYFEPDYIKEDRAL